MSLVQALRRRIEPVMMPACLRRPPLSRWFALFADERVSADFEAGLVNLKALAEKPAP
jgi:hypothetical protein